MRESGYYAPGTEFREDAPWNETTIPERDFDILCSQTLSRSTSVTTDDYLPEWDEEAGYTHANTADTDWHRVYKENNCKTPIQLIAVLKEVLQRDL